MKKVLLLAVVSSVLCACEPDEMDRYNKGVEFQKDGKLSDAEVEYKGALKINPNMAEAYLNLAGIYLGKDWYEGSIECSKKAIDIFERTKHTSIDGQLQSFPEVLSAAYNNLGAAQMGLIEDLKEKSPELAFEKWKEIIDNLKKAIEIDPQNAEAQTNLKKNTDARDEYISEIKSAKAEKTQEAIESFLGE
jgi:tetratricopeptide (TPR) repeat protein